jgi:hypothetical protein
MRLVMEHRVKPREPRQKVLIDARLRHDCGWSDARIVNLSSRGMLVRVAQAPARGSYVEIYRGPHRIVARVVWAQQDQFGAQAQDPITVDAIATGKEAEPPVLANISSDRRFRRRAETAAEKHERSRRRSRRMEFLAVTAIGCAAAFLAFDTIDEMLSKPLKAVAAALR